MKHSMSMVRFFLVLWLLLPWNLSTAGVDIVQFEQADQLKRYQNLISQLRCLVCQNQALSDSDADLARDLKHLVQQKIKAGDTDKQILDFMSQRYGDFVLYRPGFKIKTLLLWLGPMLFLLIGVFIVIRTIMRQRKSTTQIPKAQLENIHKLLNNQDSKL